MEADATTASSFLEKLESKNTFRSKRKLCEYCNKWFADKYLYAHIRLHTGNKPYVCNICQKKFNQNQNLRTHIMIHHKERKPFRCPVCGRHFMDRVHFNEHVVAHSGIKPYFCAICDKRYSYKHSLKCHLRRRHKTNLSATTYCDPANKPNKVPLEKVEEKRFFCEICDEGFVYENLLKYHMRLHNPKIKSFLCILCRRVFSRSYRFHSHLWSIHKIRIAFRCKICKDHFPDKKALSIHYDCHYLENCLGDNHLSQETDNELINPQGKEINRNKSNKHIKNNMSKKGSCSKITNAPQKEIQTEPEQHFKNDILWYEHMKTDVMQKQVEIGNEPKQDISEKESYSKITNAPQKEIEIEPEQHFEDILWYEHVKTDVMQKQVEIRNELRQDMAKKVFCSKITNAPQKGIEIEPEQHFEDNILRNEYVKTYVMQKQVEIRNELKQDMAKKVSCSKITNAPQKEIETKPEQHCEILQYEHAKTDVMQKQVEIGTELEQDIASDVIRNKYPCGVSNVSQEFKTKTESRQFCNSEITKNKYICGVCFEEFSSITSIQEHLRTHTSQHDFVCDKCKKCFDSKSLLKQHACLFNFEMKPLQCMICKEKFSIWNNFKEHLSKHANEDNAL